MMDIMDLILMREVAIDQAADAIRGGAEFSQATLENAGLVDPLDYEIEEVRKRI